VSNSSPKISPVLGNIAEIAAGGPAREVTWPGRIQLLEAIQHWDRRLWQRLDDIVTPPGTRGKPRELSSYPLRPEDNLAPNENHERCAWLEAVALLKRKTQSGEEYILLVLEVGEPSAEPQIASGEWIETILPREISFANSQILKNQSVFGAWVSTRGSKPAAIPERSKRGNSVGRPAKYDGDGFYIEILRKVIVDYGSELPNRIVLHRHVLEWCTAWPEQPEESEIRKRLARIYGTPGILL
jgi:hypothetical protein